MHWRQIQRENFTSWEKLSKFLQIPLSSENNFPLNLPMRLAEKIEKGNRQDPLFRQFVPTEDEGVIQPGFSADPVGDIAAKKEARLLHKYQGRALLVTTGACAMHCRYCFRQNFPYGEGSPSLAKELEAIAEDATIEEVLLSGGDPLSLSDRRLEEILHFLERIPHLKRVRFHTRFLVGIPERITAQLLEILKKRSLQVIFVIHCNHPRELDQEVLASLRRLRAAEIFLLNQSVLLRGVNDKVETLFTLSEKLIAAGVFPYYLHQLDRVEGSGHFEVPLERGLALIEELRKCAPGYFVPKYVQEVAGEPAKTVLHALDCVNAE